MAIHGAFSNCDLCLAGCQISPNLWNYTQNGFYTQTFRHCTNMCSFCNSSYSQKNAMNFCATPNYNTGLCSTFNNATNISFSSYAQNKSTPFWWNFLSGPGLSQVQLTSPRSITRTGSTGIIYGYEAVQFNTTSTTMSVNASVNYGVVWNSWRANSGNGIVASTNQSFSPTWNGNYSDKSGTIDYRSVYQFQARAELF